VTGRKAVPVARLSSSLVAALAALALVPAASAAQSRHATVVRAGESIQSAVDAADPGDTILVFGTHRENVAIQTDGLTLRGVGAVILPPDTPTPHACFDPTEVDEAVHGVCVIGDLDFDTREVRRRVEDVTVSGFTVRGFTGSGLVAVAAHGTTFSGNVATDNGDAEISAAQATDTLVLSNRASGGRFGIYLTDSRGGLIHGNLVHDNCVGLFAVDLGSGSSGDFRIAANSIRHNTKACSANEDFPEFSGIGLALLGGAHNTVVANLITGNVPAVGASTAASAGVAMLTSPAGPAPTDTVIKRNFIQRNDPDLLWDESGSGNVLTPNLCRTSIPAGLCE
jgi:parallel beta-helix repeat protein